MVTEGKPSIGGPNSSWGRVMRYAERLVVVHCCSPTSLVSLLMLSLPNRYHQCGVILAEADGADGAGLDFLSGFKTRI